MRTILLLCWSSTLASLVHAGDWPQILGPQRNGHAPGERLRPEWPAAGPAVVWQHPVGSGYAGPAVAAQRILIFHRIDQREILECLDAGSGKPLWKSDWPAQYRGGVDPDNGPRCVPLIAGGRVFVFGAAGDLRCVQLEAGTPLWSRALADEFSARDGYFGAGSTPLLVGDRLLVNLGGDSAGIVALDPTSGETAWTATDEGASYSSPIILPTPPSQPGPLALFVTRLNVIGLEPHQGAIQFRHPFGRRGPTVNAATPLRIDSRHVFLTASYGIGATLLKLGGTAPEVVWAGDESLSSQFPTPVLLDGHLVGNHGREDGPAASLRCIEAWTGTVAWSRERFGMAHLIRADDKLLALKADGHLLVLLASTRQYRELGSARVSGNTTRALPALSHGRFYFRDNQGRRGTLVCLDVGFPPARSGDGPVIDRPGQ
jgi:outer membrane protein assembly factor BamB